jgi:thioredoxin 1
MNIKLLITIILLNWGALGQKKAPIATQKAKIEHLNESKFNALVAQNKTVIVDFYANWCAPCKKLAPIIEKVAREKNITLLKINIDTNPILAEKLNIEGLPTVYYYNNGNLIWSHLGFLTEEELNKKIAL